MPEMTIRHGLKVIVDEQDVHLFDHRTWYFSNGMVAVGTNKNGKFKRYYLGREIMQCPIGLIVDHINGNPLDNRRVNLRICTREQNNRNRGPHKENLYKGVSKSRNTTSKIWKVQIKMDGKSVHLGYFEDQKEAAKVYDKAAKEYYGEFARLNFPDIGG
jgi:hypothetical protein